MTDFKIDMKQFNVTTRKFIKETGGRFSQKLRKIAFSVLRNVVLLQTERKAVDTGLSRANWQMDVGQVNNDIVPKETDPIESGAQNIAKLRNWGIGEIIYIFNNVEYTIYLEFGTDKMEPRAMLRDGFSMTRQSLT